MLKRIALLLAVNFLVIVTISILLNRPRRPAVPAREPHRLPAAHALLPRLGHGRRVHLARLSRVMAKWMMGVQVIDPNTTNARARR
jgi:heat shock protein HtpX